MVQPKYSPQEALDKIKLMMKYDSSKTLNENRKIISEQGPSFKNTGIATATGAGIGATAGGVAAATGANLAAGTAAGTAFELGTALLPVSTSVGAAGATALGAAVLGGAAALALVPLAMWYLDKDGAKPKVARIIQYCTTDAAKIAKIQRGNSEAEIRNLSDQLYDAMEGAGTEEEKVYGAFKSLKTASDFCALVNRFNKDYGSEDDLLEWLDSDFDSTSEWEQIYRPIRDVVEDTLLSMKDDTQTGSERQKNINNIFCSVNIKGIIENPASSYNGKKWDDYIKDWNLTQEELSIAKNACPQKGGVVKTGGGGYKSCTGTYSFGCKSDVIAKVQGCLGGLLKDGKFGPKTKAKLSDKGFTSFTDADVEKICSAAETKLTSDVDTTDLSQGEVSNPQDNSDVTNKQQTPMTIGGIE